ncbi:MAG: TIGR04282 family arsenosugar biosynthesis glycosyltransferase [Magnetococcales bacterium]|nr:TIGR04282 family arsenosugar biosynthesis glycosyltransferase [Magnetococcales bacterium]
MWANRLLLISVNVLGRAPVAGEVKTRLIPYLGVEGAAKAHEQLLAHVVGVAGNWCGKSPSRQCNLWCTPDTTHPYFDSLSAVKQRYVQPQGDLGQRMAAIVAYGLKSADRVVLLGGDGVSVSAALLTEVEAALAEVPVVMATADDGGYILLGLTSPAPTLFSDIPWGTENVAKETRLRLKSLGWQWREFPGQWDVDRPEDWDRFQTVLDCVN